MLLGEQCIYLAQDGEVNHLEPRSYFKLSSPFTKETMKRGQVHPNGFITYSPLTQARSIRRAVARLMVSLCSMNRAMRSAVTVGN